jgi:CBS domain containing-hemolysin-like protein
MTLLIIFGTLAIVVSFLCSLLEAGLLSLPRSQVEAMVERGSQTGVTLQQMKENIDRPLAAILTMNTIAHTVGAAGVGAQAAVVFGDAAVGIASAVMTLLILVFSEIIPKTLGAVHAKNLAGVTAMTTKAMIVICMPLILLLESVNRMIGYERAEESISRSEVLATVRLGRDAGSLGPREHRIVSNVLALSNIKVGKILTPRTVVFALPQTMTLDEVVDAYRPIRFARIPIYEESIEHITGYVIRFDINKALSEGRGSEPLSSLAKRISAVPEVVTVADAFEQMLREGQHILLVVDEYGGTEGIVTLEDLIETLLGQEIVDETDTVTDMQELARRKAFQYRQSRER